MMSVREALPFLDFSCDPELTDWSERDYLQFLIGPDWLILAGRVINQIVEKREKEPLGRLIPGLPRHPGSFLPVHMLSTRAQNVLGRQSVHTWGDLADLSTDDLFDLRNVGVHTVHDILRLALQFATGNLSAEVLADREDAPTPESDPRWHAIAAELRVLASWALRERPGLVISDVVNVAPDLSAPEELVNRWRDLDIKIADLADADLTEPSLADLYVDLVSRLGENRQVILEQRLLAENPKTLDELGRIRGVTREAIRLNEKRLKGDLDDLLSLEEFAPIRWRAADLGRALGALAPVAAASSTKAIERASRGVEEPQRSLVLQLLLRLAGPYQARDGWYVREDTPGVPTAHDLWDAHSPAIIMDLEECRAWLSDRQVDPSHLSEWLSTANGCRVLDGKLLRWTGSVLDKAIALLTLTGEPATPEELTESIGEGHNPRSVRNRLFEDPRVVRVDKYRVALRDWNMEEYSGIAEEIVQRIRENGGVAPLDEVVCDLVETFGVAESSVRAYAEAPVFVREGNIVRLRGDHEAYAAAGELSECAGTYLLPDGGVSYAIRVDPDVLRGSGRGCPKALAHALGVTPGQERTFTSEAGELRVTWPKASATGPALGSTRSFAAALGLGVGDDLLLTFAPADQVVTATGSSADDPASAPPSVALEQLTGLQTAGEDPRQVLGTAMGVTADTVDRVLRNRGDGHVAALLPQQRSDEDLDSALEGLANLLGSLD